MVSPEITSIPIQITRIHGMTPGRSLNLEDQGRIYSRVDSHRSFICLAIVTIADVADDDIRDTILSWILPVLVAAFITEFVDEEPKTISRGSSSPALDGTYLGPRLGREGS